MISSILLTMKGHGYTPCFFYMYFLDKNDHDFLDDLFNYYMKTN